ncbi:MAG: hypothetical protein ABIU30_23125 [Ferruginibacter sp.]
MKIIFFCGSLEPGRDGVGDYCRRLSEQLSVLGHQPFLVALNDSHISSVIEVFQVESDIEIPALRIPSIYSRHDSFVLLQDLINRFDPDYLSLQFVPFAFHSKGLPFTIVNFLKKLGKGRSWHIMFHELWVGIDKEASFKHVCWGWVQKQIIKGILRKLRPKAIHTQTRIYITMLKKLNYHAHHLPLFSNIPLNTKAKRKNNEIGFKENGNRRINFLMFAGIQPGAPILEFVHEVAEYSDKYNVEVELKTIGRCGQEQDKWETAWKSKDLPFQSLGGQSPERISEELSIASIGISTTPAFQIEKSGSVAAMLQHGLPVLCISRSWQPRGASNHLVLPKGVREYKPGTLKNLIEDNFETDVSNDLMLIAQRFVKTLSEAS